ILPYDEAEGGSGMRRWGYAALSILAGTLIGAERHEPVPAKDVRVAGQLERRLQLSERYLLAKSTKIPKDMGWGADQYGRWLEAVALLEDYSGGRSPEFERVLDEFLGLQAPDGGLLMGKLRRQEWWGATRALVGLVGIYDVSGDKRVLLAARRLGDYLAANAPIATTVDLIIHAHYHSALEGAVRLYTLTGEKRYLAFAQAVARITDPEVDVPGQIKLAHRPITAVVRGWKAHQHHTHSYLETVQGMVDLFRATGERRYLELSTGAWRQTLRHTMWVSGGIPEVYGEFFEHNDETCPVTSWMLLGLKLYRETGEGAYLDVVERSALNHLMFNQDNAGGFYADRSICARERVSPDNKGGIADACCSPHGAKALYELARHIYSTTPDTVDVNFYFESTLATRLPGSAEAVKLSMKTGYPEAGAASVTVLEAPARLMKIRLRVPGFVTQPRIRVNGKDVRAAVSEGFAAIQRRWRKGDRIEAAFPMKLRVVKAGSAGFGQEETAPAAGAWQDAALLYGPLVLMIDRQYNNLRAAGGFTLSLARTAGGEVSLPREGGPASAGAGYSWPAAHFRVMAQGESGEPLAVILTPMAEMTNSVRMWEDQYKVRNRLVVPEGTSKPEAAQVRR
ncbi:MAG: glycoside hydrolase family 127 protein, partial [Acidobacteria bacterium]|nr:glycoside hydrolase family 127 protein [Acidobacteriota bacterium]